MGGVRVLPEKSVFVERGEVRQRRVGREIPERRSRFVENPRHWTVHGERGGIDRVRSARSCDRWEREQSFNASETDTRGSREREEDGRCD